MEHSKIFYSSSGWLSNRPILIYLFSLFRNSAKAWVQNLSSQDPQIKQKMTRLLQNQRQSILPLLKISGLMFFTRRVHGHLQMAMQIGRMKTKQGITTRLSTIFSEILYMLLACDEHFLNPRKSARSRN